MTVDAKPPISAGYSGAGTAFRTLYLVNGALSPATFELNGVTYTITALVSLASGSGVFNSLLIAFMAGELPPDGPTANLVLQLDDSHELAFRSTSYTESLAAHEWDPVSPAFTWSASDMVSVKLCVNE